MVFSFTLCKRGVGLGIGAASRWRGGKIKNLDEYYAIKEVLVDTDSDISETDWATLEQIFQTFEMEYKATE